VKILCYGDSNTYGYDPRSFFGGRYAPSSRWVELFAQKSGCDCVNAGENGREIPRRDGQIRELAQLLQMQMPTLLLVMLGTNDLLQGSPPDEAVGRMEKVLEQIEFPRSRMILIAPPPMQLGEWVVSRALVDASAELGRAYRSLAQRLKIGFLDAGEWNIPMAFDGVHFTEEGHRIFAERLYEAYRKGKWRCLQSE